MKETRTRRRKVAIAGCVGLPAQYGGFETLAENLARYAKSHEDDVDLIVYCSSRAYENRVKSHAGARLVYIPLKANGVASMLYDIWSLFDAIFRGVDEVILLGHGGSFALPLIKLFSRIRILTNIDGIEWRREKWSSLARTILRSSESFAVRHSDVVIADNEAIREYVEEQFGKACEVIPYGGDHALVTEPVGKPMSDLPESYAIALCRIEPENNVEMILRAFDQVEEPLVFVGNWDASEYGRRLKAEYAGSKTIVVHEPVYDPGELRSIRDGARIYVHGHSAGGTNPALVEMMHFGIPVLAHGCSFNRYSTEEKAEYFESAEELSQLVVKFNDDKRCQNGRDMMEIARRRYTWDQIGRAYFSLLRK